MSLTGSGREPVVRIGLSRGWHWYDEPKPARVSIAYLQQHWENGAVLSMDCIERGLFTEKISNTDLIYGGWRSKLDFRLRE